MSTDRFRWIDEKLDSIPRNVRFSLFDEFDEKSSGDIDVMQRLEWVINEYSKRNGKGENLYCSSRSKIINHLIKY